MRGHVRKYKGRWAGVIELDKDPSTGKRSQKWVYADTKKECEKKVNELIRKLETGTYVDSTNLTVKEFLEKWINDYVKHNVAPSTLRSYKGIVNVHIIPRIGSSSLNKLNPLKIQSMYTDLLDTHLSTTSVLYIHRVLHRALSQAVKWGLLNSNPTDKVDPPKKRKVQFDTWDNETIAWALELSKGTVLYLPILLSATTGMREGEICGLQWKNVDLNTGQISVRHTFQRVFGKWELKNVKTSGSQRMVIISDAIIEILKSHKLKQKEHKMMFGPDYYVSDHIITWPDGKPVYTKYIGKEFKKFVMQNNLPIIRFHDLRHTHATELLKAGINPKIVSERLGHTNIRITLDTYSHVLPTLQKEAADITTSNILSFSTNKKTL